MYKHILIPTDGSPLSARAAAAGIKLAGATGARVTALFVAPAPTPLVYQKFIPVGYMTTDEHAAMIDRAAGKYLGAIEKAALSAGVACTRLQVTSDFPAEVIVDMARRGKCDLIVMASHGRKGLSSVLLGSETHKVLVRTKTPVLVYR
jgi:nucleotide-binding universal stress UspA family protein